MKFEIFIHAFERSYITSVPLSVFNPAAKWMDFLSFYPTWKITLVLYYFSLNDINKINTSALVINSYKEGQRFHSLLPLKLITAPIIMSRVTTFFGCEPKDTIKYYDAFSFSLCFGSYHKLFQKTWRAAVGLS